MISICEKCKAEVHPLGYEHRENFLREDFQRCGMGWSIHLYGEAPFWTKPEKLVPIKINC
jgi:hypothetical protein